MGVIVQAGEVEKGDSECTRLGVRMGLFATTERSRTLQKTQQAWNIYSCHRVLLIQKRDRVLYCTVEGSQHCTYGTYLVGIVDGQISENSRPPLEPGSYLGLPDY